MKSMMRSLEYIVGYPPIYLLLSGLILIAGASLSLSGAGIFGIWPRVIIGLLVFILPGCYLFVLAPTRDDWDLIDVCGYGFAYSLALVTILGLIMRTLALSIDVVEFVWYVLGILGFVAVSWRTKHWLRIKICLFTPPPPPIINTFCDCIRHSYDVHPRLNTHCVEL